MLVPPFAMPVFAAGVCAFRKVGELYHCPRMPETDDLILHTSVNRILTGCPFALADGGGRMLQGWGPCAAPQGASLAKRSGSPDLCFHSHPHPHPHLSYGYSYS